MNQVLNAIGFTMIKLLDIAATLIFIRAILSWLPLSPQPGGMFEKILGLLFSLTEPILVPVRYLLQKTPLGKMPMDFSPVAAYLVLQLLAQLVMVIFSFLV